VRGWRSNAFDDDHRDTFITRSPVLFVSTTELHERRPSSQIETCYQCITKERQRPGSEDSKLSLCAGGQAAGSGLRIVNIDRKNVFRKNGTYLEGRYPFARMSFPMRHSMSSEIKYIGMAIRMRRHEKSGQSASAGRTRTDLH
jgi:hypothetical protein